MLSSPAWAMLMHDKNATYLFIFLPSSRHDFEGNENNVNFRGVEKYLHKANRLFIQRVPIMIFFKKNPS